VTELRAGDRVWVVLAGRVLEQTGSRVRVDLSMDNQRGPDPSELVAPRNAVRRVVA
jgi:hypothetical protein